MKKKIYVCSPCKGNGNKKNNIKKALLYSKYVADHGFIPFAPHLYFTNFFDDNNPEEREIGLRLALEWLFQCDELWCFGEFVSDGMRNEIEIAKKMKMRIKNVSAETVEDFFRKR